jgi:hypothetical protein
MKKKLEIIKDDDRHFILLFVVLLGLVIVAAGWVWIILSLIDWIAK